MLIFDTFWWTESQNTFKNPFDCFLLLLFKNVCLCFRQEMRFPWEIQLYFIFFVDGYMHAYELSCIKHDLKSLTRMYYCHEQSFLSIFCNPKIDFSDLSIYTNVECSLVVKVKNYSISALIMYTYLRFTAFTFIESIFMLSKVVEFYPRFISHWPSQHWDWVLIVYNIWKDGISVICMIFFQDWQKLQRLLRVSFSNGYKKFQF